MPGMLYVSTAIIIFRIRPGRQVDAWKMRTRASYCCSLNITMSITGSLPLMSASEIKLLSPSSGVIIMRSTISLQTIPYTIWRSFLIVKSNEVQHQNRGPSHYPGFCSARTGRGTLFISMHKIMSWKAGRYGKCSAPPTITGLFLKIRSKMPSC